jgi:hypothetical protein
LPAPHALGGKRQAAGSGGRGGKGPRRGRWYGHNVCFGVGRPNGGGMPGPPRPGLGQVSHRRWHIPFRGSKCSVHGDGRLMEMGDQVQRVPACATLGRWRSGGRQSRGRRAEGAQERAGWGGADNGRRAAGRWPLLRAHTREGGRLLHSPGRVSGEELSRPCSLPASGGYSRGVVVVARGGGRVHVRPPPPRGTVAGGAGPACGGQYIIESYIL